MRCFEYIAKIKVYQFEECSMQQKELINNAKKAALLAYAPYSNYYVGSAVLLDDGKIITGNNQENAAFPSGICAERNVVFYTNAQYPETPILNIAIAAFTNGDFTDRPCTPCGACRQVLVELETRFQKNVKIIMYGKNEIYEVDSIKQLLPLTWDANNL